MERPQVHYVGLQIIGVVESIVRLSKPLTMFNHERGALYVVGSSGNLQLRCCFKPIREGVSFKTVRGCVTEVVLHGRRKETSPSLMHSRLKKAKRRPVV